MKDSPLISLIRQGLREDRVVAPMGKNSWLRVSGLARLCAREEVLCVQHGVSRRDEVSPDLGLIFEHGHALHWVLQNRVLPLLGEVLRGRWRCMACGNVHGGRAHWIVGRFSVEEFVQAQVPRPSRCRRCSSILNSDSCFYEEQNLVDLKLRLGGHPDGFLAIPGEPHLGILEGKSISAKGALEVRQCPKHEHVIQTQAYMRLTGLTWAKVLYWNKGGSGMSALAEHTLRYDDALVERIMSTIHSVRGESLPDRICGSAQCPRAKVCPVAKQCFEVP